MLKFAQQKGFTLVELVIGVGLGSLLITGMLSSFVSSNRAALNQIAAATLDHEMRTAIYLIKTDIRRAGFWNDAINDLGSNANNNPFMQSGTDITIDSPNNCILFTYDTDADGNLATLGTR